MKNYVKEDQKLPMYGIGPYLALSMVLLTAAAIILCNYIFKIGILNGVWAWLFRIAGFFFFILGTVIWFTGALNSGMDDNIADNKLKTDGIYAWVRNPMYTGIWFVVTGISLLWHNIFLIPVFFINWTVMTAVLKRTEEKWLLDLYGDEYSEYMARVNRCIPWKSKF